MNQQKRKERKKAKAAWQARKQHDAVEAYPLEMVRANAVDRPCGSCTGCCTAIAVHEIDKPMWTDCQHQDSSGCGIYAERPESCRTYYCFWQGGILKGEENRPDKLGIILDYRATTDDKSSALSVWELWEDALDQPKVQKLLLRLAKTFIIIIRRYSSSKRRIMGPPERLKSLQVIEIN